MEYTIELCVNYNDCGVDFTDYDVEEIIGEYDTSNKEEVERFYNELFILFRKTAEFHDINPKEWKGINHE